MALEDLNIYKLQLEVVGECVTICRSLKNAREFALADQLMRAAISIGNNLSEGYGRSSTGERLMMMFYADGSIQEVKNCVRVAITLNQIDQTRGNQLIAKLGRLSIGLMGLCSWMLNKDPSYNGKFRKAVNARLAWRNK